MRRQVWSRTSMSNLTTASTVFATVVLAAATALGWMMWRAADRVGDRRLRFIAAGFGFLALKSIVSIYTVQTQVWHHEVAEMVGAAFDVVIVACLAAPLALGR